MVLPRTAIRIGVALVALLLLIPSLASAAPPKACGTKTMYLVAHEDDTLLFQSPELLQDIRNGRCVRTVFLTAGDAGKPQSYWSSREAGVEAAYAQMAGEPDDWTGSQIVADGHTLTLDTLDEEPGISIVYMRLPDGGTDGKGFPAYGEQSLVKLWRGGNPGHGSPTISQITSVDGVSTYSYAELIETLEQLIVSYEPRMIATQNYNEGLFEGDHPDHTTTGYFARSAAEEYSQPHQLFAYGGYPIANQPANVSGAPLGAKSFAFYTYGLDDPDACSDELSCSSTIYANWLQREYVTGSKTVGVVADAGDLQETTPNASVTLDGSASSIEGGGPLSYEWEQTKGPHVTLGGANTAEPSFTAPNHPTLLTFSLVVSGNLLVSEADTVMVRVPSSDPSPVAIVGPPQEVGSGTSVALSGSESFDPNSLALEYAWIQTGGPLVALSGASTSEPSFLAPTGPATLTFHLVVSNGEQTSSPATQTVTVKGIAPSFTSKGEASFTAGTESSYTVSTSGSPSAAISILAGSLPRGLGLEDNGDGSADISGIPADGTAPAGGKRDYPLTLSAENSEGTVSQEFTLVVHRAPLPPPALEPEDKSGNEAPTSTSPNPPAPQPPSGGVRPRLSRALVTLPATSPSRRVVKVVGGQGSAVRCAGRLPAGVRCRVHDEAVVVRSGGKLNRGGTYRLKVTLADADGLLRRPLSVRIRSPR
jgi:LmbE family N-acetylglucosaminyl deacetylase